MACKYYLGSHVFNNEFELDYYLLLFSKYSPEVKDLVYSKTLSPALEKAFNAIKEATQESSKLIKENRSKRSLTDKELVSFMNGLDDVVLPIDSRNYTGVTMFMHSLRDQSIHDPYFPLFDFENYWNKFKEKLVVAKKEGWASEDPNEHGKSDEKGKIWFTKELAGLLFGIDTSGKIQVKDVPVGELSLYKERLLKIWEYQKDLGTGLHAVINFVMTNFGHGSETTTALKNALFKERDTNDYLKSQIEIMSDAQLMEAVKCAHLIRKGILEQFPGGHFFNEVNIAGTGISDSNQTIGVLGRIDLLVIDKEGDVHIIDYKCSPKKYQEFDPAKKRTFMYLLSIYKRLINLIKGMSAKRIKMHVLPIMFKNFHTEPDSTDPSNPSKFDIKYEGFELEKDSVYHTKITKDLDAEIDAFTDSGLRDRIESVLNFYLPRKYNENLADLNIGENYQEFMKKAFPEYHKTYFEDITNEDILKFIENNGGIVDGKDKKGEDCKMVVVKLGKHNQTYRGKNEIELVNNIKKAWLSARETPSGLVDDILNEIETAQETGILKIRTGNNLRDPSSGHMNYSEKVLLKYIDKTLWRDLSEDDLDSETFLLLKSHGIILFQNMDSGQIDVVKLTNKNIFRQFYLKGALKRLYILGEFLSDEVQTQDSNSLSLQSISGNIEMMETMALLNGMAKFLAVDGKSIGLINVLSPLVYGTSYIEGITASNELLAYNFNRLCDLTGFKSNFNDSQDGIRLNSYAQLAMHTLHDIVFKYNLNSWKLSSFENSKKFMDAFEAANGDKIKTLELMNELRRDLEEHFPTLKGSISRDLLESSENPEFMLYNLVLSAIAELNDMHIILLIEQNDKYFKSLDILDILLHGVNGSYLDNPGTLKSKNLNRMALVTERGYLNVRTAVMQFNNELLVALLKLKDEKSFTWGKKVTTGNLNKLYENLYDRTNGQFLFKNIDDKTLTPAEKEFLEFSLKKLALDRDPEKYMKDGKFNEEVFLADYRSNPDFMSMVPLVQGSFSSAVTACGGFLKAIAWKFKLLMPKRLLKYLNFDEYSFLKDGGDDDEKTKAKKGELYEYANRIDNSYLPEVREGLLFNYDVRDKDGNPESKLPMYETNLEKILLASNMARNMQKEMNKIFPIMKAIITNLTYLGFILNTDFANDILYAKDYIKNKILGLPLDDIESWGTAKKVATKLASTASKVALVFNPMLLYLVIDGLWKDIMLVILRPDTTSDGQTAFTKKNMTDSFKWIIQDIYHFGDKPSLGEAINRLYGINDMDINKYQLSLSTDNAGFFNFWSIGFRFASRPDFYNRMTIFGAQMRADGCFEAHSVDENGILQYDFSKDKRFEKYLNNDKSDIDLYNKQKALYLTMALEFISEGALNPDGSLFKLGNDNKPTPLPRAYTTRQSESMKALGDKIYGYYAHEKKSMIQSYTLGSLFMQMHTYWSSKKNQYISGRGFTQQGEYKQYTEKNIDANGNEVEEKYYIRQSENGGVIPVKESELNEDEPKIPYMVWKGRPQEGIIVTAANLVRDIVKGDFVVDPKTGEKVKRKGWEYMKEKNFGENVDPDVKNLYNANLRQLLYDLLMLLIMGGLVAPALFNGVKEHIKDVGNANLGDAMTNDALYAAAKMFLTSTDDFNPVKSILGLATDWTPFSILQAKNVASNIVDWMGGKKDTYDTLISIPAATRNNKPLFDFIKIQTLGRGIGEKAEA